MLEIREGIESISVGGQFGYAGSSAQLLLVPGAPYGAIFGTSYARYYGPGGEPELGEGEFRVLDGDAPLLIGADGFPVVDRTLRVLGNMTPDWTGGLYNRIAYKNVELSALVDVSVGNDKYNQFNNFFAAFGIAPYTLDRTETVVFEGVTADGQPNTTPVFLGQGEGPDGVDYGAGYYRNTYRASTENSVMDASYVKLRNVSLAYGLPSQLLGRRRHRPGAAPARRQQRHPVVALRVLGPRGHVVGGGLELDRVLGARPPRRLQLHAHA